MKAISEKLIDQNLPWDRVIDTYLDIAYYYALQGDKQNQHRWAHSSLEILNRQSEFQEISPEVMVRVLYLSDQYEKALPLYEDLAKSNPTNWRWWSRIGIIYARTDKFERANELISNLKAMDSPKYEGAWMG